jgi:ribosomal protein S18 acetylase RimI-like enzyme
VQAGLIGGALLLSAPGVIRRSPVWVAVEQPEDATATASETAAQPQTTTAAALLGVLVLEIADDHLLLDTIAVSPQARGLGLGNQLMSLAEQVARQHRCDRIRLYAHVAMVENIAYYQRHGYVETDRRDGEGFNRVFFAKQLT